MGRMRAVAADPRGAALIFSVWHEGAKTEEDGERVMVCAKANQSTSY